LSLSQWQLGKLAQAKAGWAELLATHPGGYYGWRAAVRLGRDDIDLDPDTAPGLAPPPWHPLDSGRQDLDRLWRLGQTLEAWEQWRHLRGEAASPDPAQLLVEGRLRRGVGDHWMGLAQLEQASLRLPAGQCPQSLTLERSLAEPAFTDELNQAARDARLPATLLAAVAKQESRFSAAVRSPVGATGLLQLMPETAAELAGTPLPVDALTDPQRNASLGARYLRQLLDRWEGNPLLMTASYNAGAGAVEGWISPLLPVIPELWVEAIPYPETRLYVKKVLGNLWSFQEPRLPLCR
jgi:soluble lytic murein transglycosylase